VRLGAGPVSPTPQLKTALDAIATTVETGDTYEQYAQGPEALNAYRQAAIQFKRSRRSPIAPRSPPLAITSPTAANLAQARALLDQLFVLYEPLPIPVGGPGPRRDGASRAFVAAGAGDADRALDREREREQQRGRRAALRPRRARRRRGPAPARPAVKIAEADRVRARRVASVSARDLQGVDLEDWPRLRPALARGAR
jgi:hypothetical protein